MKTLKLIVALLILGISANVFAQQTSNVPHAFKYQAVARDSKGDVISNQNVSFRISILQGSETGTVVYQETQAATTNQFGLANLSIGKGNVTNGNFSDVDWSTGSYFVKVEFDPNGGTNYSLVSTSEMLSVPYALYAEQTNFPIKAKLQGTNLQAPFNEPETGMLVYNTDSAGTNPYNVIPGYYYNAGTPETPNWISLSFGKNNSSVDRVLSCTTDQYGTCAGPATPGNNNNTGYGYSALNTAGGTDNTALGNYSMLLASGSYNTVIGSLADDNTTTGSDNTIVGYAAGKDGGTGYNYVTAIGYEALNTCQNGNTYNTATGFKAMYTGGGDYNTANGANALYSAAGGSEYNAATGYAALYTNSTGTDNVANGYEALYNNTASNNTATGYNSLYTNSSGTDNVASGVDALYTNSTASSNNASGAYALYLNTGDQNSAFGDSALYNNASGIDNVAIGYEALLSNNTANNNTAVGVAALLKNTTGSDNEAFGFNAMHFGYTGARNTATGASALYGNSNNITGSSNTANGFAALYNSYSGDYNVAVGDSALVGNTSGNKNTAVGYQALKSNSTGSENTAIGYGADVGSSGLTNATAIGYNSTVSASNTMVLGNNVEVGIGTNSPSAGLDIADGGSNTNCHIKSEGTAPTYNSTTANNGLTPVFTGSGTVTGGTDARGVLTFSGTNNGTNSTFQINFNKSYGAAPYVLITPASSGAQSCTYYVTSATGSFTINIKGGGASPSFNYFIIE